MALRIKRIFLILFCVFIFFGLVAFFSNAATVYGEGTESHFSIQTSKKEVRADDTFTLTLQNKEMFLSVVTGGIAFEKDYLECVSIAGSDPEYPSEVGLYINGKYWTRMTAVSTTEEANRNGTVGFALVNVGNTRYAAGTVYTVTFRAKKAGKTTITLYEDSAGTDAYRNEKAGTIDVSIQNGDGGSDTPGGKDSEPSDKDPSGGEDPADNLFEDVSERDYYYEPVKWAVEKSITQGTRPKTFSPGQSCTRAQIVTFLWRGAGEPKATGENPFIDVSPQDYYYSAVLWAVQKGITKGTSENTFSPEQVVDRGQAVTFLSRQKEVGASEVSDEKNPFEDVSAGDYYYEPVLWALKNDVTKGVSESRFAPKDPCTRGQIVTFMYRAENI